MYRYVAKANPPGVRDEPYAQVNAVARARGLPVAEVSDLVKSQIRQPQFGFLGASYINVLQLNEALARLG